MKEYLWIYWTFKGEWDFYRDVNFKPKYMTKEEAAKAYDSLYKVKATKRIRGWKLNEEKIIKKEK